MSEQPAESSTPKLTRNAAYVNALYDLMDRKSTDEKIGEMEVRVWRGSITKACKEVGVPDGVYRRVVETAENLGIIEILQQGNKGQPTVAILHYPPTEEVWLRAGGQKVLGEPLTQRETLATLSQKQRDISESLGGLNVAKALAEQQQQIDRLGLRLKKVEELLNGKKPQKPQ